MTSISGKTSIDWAAFAEKIAPVEVISEPVLVKKRSRDFFWYSPILNEELKTSFGDLVARPKTAEQLKICLGAAYEVGAPVVMRGGGTGNYGQAVPVDGGLIIETTAMNRVLEIGEDFVRVEAGALMADINAALKEHGREMTMFPSTLEIATIGGFIAGGSAGIGSLANGRLRERGNMIEIRALSLEAEPEEHVFRGDDVMKIHHAWGLNGAITEVTLRTVPTCDWVACIATFESYADAYLAGYMLSNSDLSPKLVSLVDARIANYFPRLKGRVREECDLLVSYIPPDELSALRTLIEEGGGRLDLAMKDAVRESEKIPHAFEFSYNHTTLQVLKSSRAATYQQIGVADAADLAAIRDVRAALGDDVWTHHEFLRADGEVGAIDLPIIWYSTPERLEEINGIYRAHGFTVWDAHRNRIEGGGVHDADYTHLAWKKRMDPKGLMNSAKSIAWPEVKDLSPEEIEARAGSAGAA
ncbi:MAG: FAD-binding oxidoreductase [Pseudomonadota bacterium]